MSREDGRPERALRARQAGQAAALAALLLLTSACDTDRQHSPEAAGTTQPWPASTPDLGYEEALASIPLAGSAQRPLHWRVADGLDQLSPVQVVQHLVALVNQILSSAEPQTPYALLPHVERGSVAQLIRQYLSDWYRLAPPAQFDPGYAGPRWVWVVDGVFTPDGAEGDECLPILTHNGECAPIDRRHADAVVTLCFDNGYWLPADGRPHPTSPVADRVEIRSYVVMHLPTGSGERRWLVTRSQLGTSVAEERYRQPCEQWAAGNRPESED